MFNELGRQQYQNLSKKLSEEPITVRAGRAGQPDTHRIDILLINYQN